MNKLGSSEPRQRNWF